MTPIIARSLFKRRTLLVRLWLALALVLFTLIDYNDSKWQLPIIMWSLMGVFQNDLLVKLICILTVVSWAYLWVAVFRPQAFPRYPVVAAIGVLLALVVFLYDRFSNDTSAVTRNQSFILYFRLFLLVAAPLIVYVLWRGGDAIKK